jgi:hypothetical protein
MNEETTETKKPVRAGAIVLEGRVREYTLDTLGPLLGTFQEDLRVVVFDITTEAQLWRRGKGADSNDILSDAPLLLGSAHDIWQILTPAQRDKVNIDLQLLALCLDECYKLRDLAQQHGALAAVTSGAIAGRNRGTKQMLRELRAARRSLLDSLHDALDEPALATVLRLVGLATRKALVDGSERLAGHVTGLLDRASEDEQLRLRTYNITAERATELRNKVMAVRAATLATAAPAPRVDQRRLDIQDGRVLFLMSRIYRAFRAARREDPSILLPEVRTLANILTSRARTTPRKPPSTPKTPTSPTGTDTGGATEPPTPPSGAKQAKTKKK